MKRPLAIATIATAAGSATVVVALTFLTPGASAGQSGVLDDGKELLPQAAITLEEAISAAQAAASGPVDEVDLEHFRGRLVFNVDVGDRDVKVDALTGAVMDATSGN
jgi:uncharacterized membrane protein YkoI